MDLRDQNSAIECRDPGNGYSEDYTQAKEQQWPTPDFSGLFRRAQFGLLSQGAHEEWCQRARALCRTWRTRICFRSRWRQINALAGVFVPVLALTHGQTDTVEKQVGPCTRNVGSRPEDVDWGGNGHGPVLTRLSSRFHTEERRRTEFESSRLRRDHLKSALATRLAILRSRNDSTERIHETLVT